MSKFLPFGHGRLVLQFCAAAAVSALVAGCSTDSTRLSDPFSNPFTTSSNEPVRHVASRATIPAGRTPPVLSRALPAGSSAASSGFASAAPLRPNLTAQTYGSPISHETTGSIEPAPVRSARGASYGGWTSSGGVPITVGAGETADLLSKRYGVPAAALLQTNGLNNAGELRPGSSLVVPVYNAVAATAPVRTVAQAEPPHAAEAPHTMEPPRTPEHKHMAQATLMKPRAERMAAADQRHTPSPAKLVAEAPAKPAVHDRVAKAEAKVEAKVAETKAAEPKPMTRKDVKAKAGAEARAAAPVQAVAPTQVAARTVDKAPAAVKTAALKPAPVKTPAVKTAAVAAPAAPAPVQAVVAPKPDPTPTASVASAPAPVVADAAGGPEFRWPARGRIIQGFKGGNDGINIAVPDGTPVKAAETGTVAYAGSELKGYGNLVLIRHPNGFVTAYANNGELDVKRGDQVKRGQVIAKSGQSGNVASPQLHFELRKGSTPVDPTSYLAGL